jgi:hypothetical protein
MHSAPIVLVNRAGHADDAYSARLESVAALKNHPQAAVVQVLALFSGCISNGFSVHLHVAILASRLI